MKTFALLSNGGLTGIFLACLTSVAFCEAVPATKMVFRDAATHDQLSRRLPKLEQDDPMKSLPPSALEDPAKNMPKDLLSQSDIISFGGLATLVPKRAILQIPANYAARLKFVEGSQIRGWSDFYALNRGWITTVEITRQQAEGNQPMPEETSKQLTKSGNLVVAVYKGGPISMLPLKAPVEKAATATASVKP
jgi:hypothetical protein